MADLVSPDYLKRILEELGRQYDFVVVDSATIINDTVLTALDLADRIVLVATPDIPAIKNAHRRKAERGNDEQTENQG